MICLERITRTYQLGETSHTVLKDVSLDIDSGACVAIVGPSGSGKSTLMNILGLLDSPTSGEYRLNDAIVSKLSEDEAAKIRNRSIGFVFQQFHLLPRINVLENVGLPLFYQYLPTEEREARAMAGLEAVGLAEKARYYPNQLSGGQQQRVAIARALINEPQLILADEPTGALDSTTSDQIMRLFFDLHAKHRSTLIVITHDKEVAARCPRNIHIQDGRIDE